MVRNEFFKELGLNEFLVVFISGKKKGTTKSKDRTKTEPQTIAVATGPKSMRTLQGQRPENNPAMVVITVITIGTTRRRPAYTVACFKLIPAINRSFAALINTIAEFTQYRKERPHHIACTKTVDYR